LRLSKEITQFNKIQHVYKIYKLSKILWISMRKHQKYI